MYITRYAVVWVGMKFFVVTFLVTVALMTATFVEEVSAQGGSCTPDIECRSTREGHYYWGSKDTTVSGTPCQSWSASSPHVPDSDFVTDFNFPEGSVAGAFNKCRNPDIGFYDGVWCYTMDPNKRWELCDVPLCPCKDSSIWYYTHYTYDKVMARYGQVTLRETVAAWRKRFVGYIHRLPATRPACLDLEWTQEDDRKRVGRPKRSWQDTLKEDMEEMGVACSEVRETASDRARWRQLVSPDDPLGTGGTKSKSKDAHSGSGSEVPSGVQGRNLDPKPAHSDCNNHGTCEDEGPHGLAYCLCEPDWDGINCEYYVGI